jgi:hypothetical protein
MASRTEKLRRRQHRKDKKRQRESSQGLGFGRSGDMVVVDNPPGPKMSEALVAILEPEFRECADEGAMRKLLTLGLIAWNAALMEGSKRKAFLQDMAKPFPSELREDFQVAVEPFIHRKLEMFPHIHRTIFNYELTWSKERPHVSVVYALD